MNGLVLRYQTRHPARSASDIEIHLYPFIDLPKIISHVDPKLVIAQLGRSLANVESREGSSALIEQYPILDKVGQIWACWTSELPRGFREDPSFVAPEVAYNDREGGEQEEEWEDEEEEEGYVSDGDSVATAPRRIPCPPLKYRKRPNGRCSPILDRDRLPAQAQPTEIEGNVTPPAWTGIMCLVGATAPTLSPSKVVGAYATQCLLNQFASEKLCHCPFPLIECRMNQQNAH
ncbi:hypothetical protein BKA70DRAFT_1579404 [Coprinopsis sp. MPI-PUGE-AT-0042]|nr:hypothetical protein BKA70DRAFT_1579404 [Coprinopsis sp. MPI-PUGE-AT-0042]